MALGAGVGASASALPGNHLSAAHNLKFRLPNGWRRAGRRNIPQNVPVCAIDSQSKPGGPLRSLAIWSSLCSGFQCAPLAQWSHSLPTLAARPSTSSIQNLALAHQHQWASNSASGTQVRPPSDLLHHGLACGARSSRLAIPWKADGRQSYGRH